MNPVRPRISHATWLTMWSRLNRTIRSHCCTPRPRLSASMLLPSRRSPQRTIALRTPCCCWIPQRQCLKPWVTSLYSVRLCSSLIRTSGRLLKTAATPHCGTTPHHAVQVCQRVGAAMCRSLTSPRARMLLALCSSSASAVSHGLGRPFSLRWPRQQKTPVLLASPPTSFWSPPVLRTVYPFTICGMI